YPYTTVFRSNLFLKRYLDRTDFTFSSAQSRSSFEMMSGGAKRMTVSCVSLQRMPSSLSSSQYGRAGSASSTPMNSPRPLISLMAWLSIFLSSALTYSPRSLERPTRSSSIMTSSAASDTAQASGLPPNVEPWDPGLNTSSTSLSATTAEIGNTPPPRALPRM